MASVTLPLIAVDGIGVPEVTLGTGWGAFLLLGFLVVRAVMKGQLVPRSTYDDMEHDRSEWRGESRIKDAQIAEKDRQLSHMKEIGELVAQAVAVRRRDAGGTQ